MNQTKLGYKQTKVGVIPEDWEVVKVGEKFDFLKTYSNSREDLNNVDKISYIHYGEIHTKHKFYIDFAKFELPKINKSKLPNEIIFAQNGDLVIADASEDYADIGKSAEIKNLTSKAVSGLHTFLLRDKNNNFADGYKGYLLYNETVAKSIKKIATGISVLGISKTNLSNLQIPLPPLKEQEKIAKILTTWDEAITKQTELLRAKELQKKALMQKLLSGEVRFSGFSDEWEEVRLSKIIKLQGGYAFKSEEFKKSGIPIIRISNISNSSNYMEMDDLVYYDELPNESNFLIKRNDLLIAMSGATTGKVSIYNLEEKAYLNQRVGLFKAIKPSLINYSFFTQFIFSNFFSVQLTSLLVAGAQPNISSKDIESLKIKLPSLPEQQKIAEVLSLADDEINLLKNELKELKLQKKALMQKLLTGQVRVKV